MDWGMRGMGRKNGSKRWGKGGMRESCGEDGAVRERGLHRRRRQMLYIGILTSLIGLQIAAWCSREFCDWYLEHVFGIWVGTYGRLMGMAPFSVGEVLIGLWAGFWAAGAVLGAMWLTGRAAAWSKKGWKRERRNWLGRACRAYCQAGLWMLLGALALMTLNCYMLYHGSGFSGTYLIGEDREYTFEELAALRNFVVERCNGLCCQMPRKEDGSLVYEGDMLETAKAAMQQLGETYEGLGGFYPTPKPLLSSDFMSQQQIAGCYYPFSMEANYNDVMYVMNLPSTLCHELGHLKGYIREDEANLIGYLACVQSEDIFFQYSGYLSVLYYVDKDFRQAMESGAGLGSEASWQGEGSQRNEAVPQSEGKTQPETLSETQPETRPETQSERQPESLPETLSERQSERQLEMQPEIQSQEKIQLQILPQVHADNIFLMPQERTRIERDALLDTEAVDAISDSIADASLKLNGVQDGMLSYSRVVELLLRYYHIYGYP